MKLPLAMLIDFGSAKLLGKIVDRLHQPGIVGEPWLGKSTEEFRDRTVGDEHAGKNG